MKKITLLALTLSVGANVANAGDIGLDLLGAPGTWQTIPSNDSWTLGFEFSVAATTEVSGLGFWDFNGSYNSTSVGLWDTSGTLLGSVNSDSSPVSSFAAGNGHGTWNFMSFDFTLGAGNYVVGSWGAGMDYTFNENPNSISTNGLTFVDTREQSGGIFQYPGNELCPNCDSGFFGANIEFGEADASVPEPGVISLMLLGLAGLGLRNRNRKAA